MIATLNSREIINRLLDLGYTVIIKKDLPPGEILLQESTRTIWLSGTISPEEVERMIAGCM